MYKTLEFDELLELKSGFFDTLARILKRNRCLTLKDYSKKLSRKGKIVYHFERQACIWKTEFREDVTVFYDEQEKIELQADKAVISKLNTILMNPKKIERQRRNSISLEERLFQEFEAGDYQTIGDKPYLVYDIETSYASNDHTKTEFYVGYAYVVEDWIGKYKYIDQSNLTKFIDFLLEFDGYIVGFNNLAFDNPVAIAQWLDFAGRYSDQEAEKYLELINQKSLDIYQFVLALSKKRIWLNNLAQSLVWVAKTLDSGAEVQTLRESYQDGDKKALSKIKKYCKNDVKMTYLTLWMLLREEELSIEGVSYAYDSSQFIELSNKEQFMQPWEEWDDSNRMFL